MTADASLRLAVFVDEWPALSETFVLNELRALSRLGVEVRVEAGRRAVVVAGGVDDEFTASIGTEDGPGEQWRALIWLAARHPIGCLRDLRARARWRAEEEPRPFREFAVVVRRVTRFGAEHLHAHFAAGAALDALRAGALLGIPVSVTAHANDIYANPRNLAEKLRRADFVTSGCAYTVNDLRRIGGAGVSVHEVIMGVDPDRFHRTTAYPGTRTVVAVGRLVAKKGFLDLVAAAVILRSRGQGLGALVIAGEGPQRADLEAAIEEGGIGDVARLTGPVEADTVRELLLDADVLAAPCVVAPDGDRDSMPLVVKEALAMEVPVVASNEVGLPEVVHEGWGTLHPPGDVEALADALQWLLGLSVIERAAMGTRGRDHVIRQCHVDVHTARLLGLMHDAVAARSGR